VEQAFHSVPAISSNINCYTFDVMKEFCFARTRNDLDAVANKNFEKFVRELSEEIKKILNKEG